MFATILSFRAASNFHQLIISYSNCQIVQAYCQHRAAAAAAAAADADAATLAAPKLGWQVKAFNIMFRRTPAELSTEARRVADRVGTETDNRGDAFLQSCASMFGGLGLSLTSEAPTTRMGYEMPLPVSDIAPRMSGSQTQGMPSGCATVHTHAQHAAAPVRTDVEASSRSAVRTATDGRRSAGAPRQGASLSPRSSPQAARVSSSTFSNASRPAQKSSQSHSNQGQSIVHSSSMSNRGEMQGPLPARSDLDPWQGYIVQRQQLSALQEQLKQRPAAVQQGSGEAQRYADLEVEWRAAQKKLLQASQEALPQARERLGLMEQRVASKALQVARAEAQLQAYEEGFLLEQQQASAPEERA